MEKYTNYNNSQEKSNQMEEQILLDGNKYPISFTVQIISKEDKLVNATMSFDYENNRVIFITEDSRLIISVKSKEILGFVPPEHVNQDFRYKYRPVISIIDPDHKLCLFNFYPKFQFNRCNCCGWVCCNCTETVSINKAKVFLLPINII